MAGSLRLSLQNGAWMNNLMNPMLLFGLITREIGQIFSAVTSLPLRLLIGQQASYINGSGGISAMYANLALGQLLAISVFLILNAIQWYWIEAAVARVTKSDTGFRAKYGPSGLIAMVLIAVASPALLYFMSSMMMVGSTYYFYSALPVIELPIYLFIFATLVSSRFALIPIRLFRASLFSIDGALIIFWGLAMHAICQILLSIIPYSRWQNGQGGQYISTFDPNNVLVQFINVVLPTLVGGFVVAVWFCHLHRMAKLLVEQGGNRT